MWQFEYIEPIEDIKPFVNNYLFANHTLEKPLNLNIFPANHAFFSNSFSRNKPESIYTIDDKKMSREGRWRLGGPVFNQRVEVYEPTEIRILFCVLKPTALSRLFRINGEQLTSKNCDLSHVAPQTLQIAQSCFQADQNASTNELVAEGNQFFKLLAARADEKNAIVEASVEIFESHNGAITVSDICDQLSTTPKTLNRYFKKIVGISPKAYAKILQVNWVMGQMHLNNSETLSELALKAGFFDQSHFTKSVQELFRQSPAAFLKSRHFELSSYINEINQKGPILAMRGDDTG